MSSRQVMALGVVLALLGCDRVAILLHSAPVDARLVSSSCFIARRFLGWIWRT